MLRMQCRSGTKCAIVQFRGRLAVCGPHLTKSLIAILFIAEGPHLCLGAGGESIHRQARRWPSQQLLHRGSYHRRRSRRSPVRCREDRDRYIEHAVRRPAAASGVVIWFYIAHAPYSVQKNSPNDFVLLVASADTRPDAVHDLSLRGGNAKLTVRYGDFAGPMSRVVKALTEVRAVVYVC